MAADQEKPPEDTASIAPAPKVEEPKAKSYPMVLFKGEIKIFPDRPLPKYNQGAVKAYEALTASGNQAFALVCEKNIVPQAEIVHKYAGITTPHLPKLLACGVVEWSVDFKERLVFLYEDKMGLPVTAGKNPAAVGIKAEHVISTIFRNLLEIMRAMRDKGIAHGNIRATNIFDGGTATFENAMLGEMLSTPSGYAQPVIYETIERGLCHPLGRGLAEISDDIYALGVTLATLIRTYDPAEGMSDEDIITAKIEVGSFNFIVGKSRFPAAILEFLRGALNDDPESRWTFDDIMTWAEGRRVSAKQTTALATLKASRPLDFMRRKFLKPELLAVALSKDPSQVVPLVENGDLSLWLNRSIQDKELETRYDEGLIEAKREVGSSNYADRLASIMAIALEPDNPIFYKDLKFSPMGFGSLLADASQTKKDLGPFVDVMQGNMIAFWGKSTTMQTRGVSESINRMGSCRSFMQQSMIGSGLERCVYYLSPNAPCFSEKLEQFYVRSAEDFLNALEKMSSQKNRPEWFLDRHIIAFLLVRDKNIIEPFLPDLAASEKHRQRQGMVKMLATIQKRDKMGALPGLSQWVVGMLDNLVDRYHDREKRKAIREQLEKMKTYGSLERIAALFNNYEEAMNDKIIYTQQMQQYQALKKEYFMLEQELDNNKNFGIEAGKQAAALVSGLISAIVVVIYLFFVLTNGGGGSIF
ncbi:MAG: hypothetical protein A3B66_07975 [Alphaproteobacteria bacterium RIFCSPHIGHO2_02_FULL_46_13]|nr:MAG: hypothetical protein A3B66_07975 [Alphaproteobacteria bacterium RIFCSPHIGHO2_02_FULL_46_13]